MPIKIYHKADIAARILVVLLTLFILGLVVVMGRGVLSSMAAQNQGGAIVYTGGLALCLIVLGAVFARYYLPYFIDRGVASLFLPDQKISEPADLLSPIQGLILRERYDEALGKLADILDERPDSMGANFLLARLYFNELDRPELGMAVVERYFAPGHKIPTRPENIDAILSYCDAACELGFRDRAVGLLEREIGRGYAAGETRMLRQRLETLAGG